MSENTTETTLREDTEKKEEKKEKIEDSNTKESDENEEQSEPSEKSEKVSTNQADENIDQNAQYFLVYNPETRAEERIYLHSNPKETFDENEEYYIGIDEAGRGPVLGPLVYACAYFPVSQKTKLNTLKFQDSKTLTEMKRWQLFKSVQKHKVGYTANIIRPIDISELFFHTIEKTSLNKLSHDRTVEMIQSLLQLKMKITEVYVDTVGVAKDYERYLQAKFPEIQTIVVTSKADSIYPIVSAASICAKVIRDLMLKQWIFPESLTPAQRSDYRLIDVNINNKDKKDNNEEESKVKYEREFGSGYTGDPITKKWLENASDPIFGYPSIVRFSWKTTERLLEKRSFPVYWEHEDQLENFQKKKKKTAQSPASKRISDHHSRLINRSFYFATRGMNTASQL